jgi:hypothetical protein
MPLNHLCLRQSIGFILLPRPEIPLRGIAFRAQLSSRMPVT